MKKFAAIIVPSPGKKISIFFYEHLKESEKVKKKTSVSLKKQNEIEHNNYYELRIGQIRF